MTILFGSVLTAAGIGFSSLATGVKLLVAVFGVLAGEQVQLIILINIFCMILIAIKQALKFETPHRLQCIWKCYKQWQNCQ